MPICLKMYRNKLVISNPGGLYGRISVDNLGHAQPDTRNQYLVVAMEALGITENRYSGIPCIRKAMEQAGLPAPEFRSQQGEFRITLYSEPLDKTRADGMGNTKAVSILGFCAQPRSRQEIAAFLGISSVGYATQKYISPLVEKGQLLFTNPDAPRSHNQKFVAARVRG